MLMSDIERFHISGVEWPDLTAPHFFLWRHLKEWIHRNRPHTVHAILGCKSDRKSRAVAPRFWKPCYLFRTGCCKL